MQAIHQLRTRVKSSKDVSTTSYVIITRMTLLWALLSLKIAIIAVDVHTESVVVSGADYIYYILTILVIILNINIQLVLYKCRVRASSVQFFYWLSHLVCYIPTFKQDLENILSNEEITISSLSVTYFVLSFVVLGTQWLGNWPPDRLSENQVRNKYDVQSGNKNR